MAADNAIELHRVRDFGKKFNATIEFIKRNFKPLFKSMLYISGPFVIIGSLFITQVMNNIFTMGFATGLTDQPDASEIATIGGLTLLGLILIILGAAAIVATVYDYMYIYDQKGSSEIEVGEVWNRVKKSIWKVLGTMILYFLLFLVCYVVLLIPVFAFGTASPALSFIGVILLFVGILYFIVGSSLVFIISSFEGVGFGTAIGRSFKLVKSNWWSTFGLILVAGFIRNVISSIFFIPWYASFIVGMLSSVESGQFQEPSLAMEIFNYVTLLMYMIVNTVLFCLPLIVIAFQYFSLVEKKEAKGLMHKIESFGITEITEDEEEHY